MKGGTRYLIGIDEVGRGPLAGPLCVGACAVLRDSYEDTRALFSGVKDSKKLSPEKRLFWFERIQDVAAEGALFVATSSVSERMIDRRGIACALKVAIRRVLTLLGFSPRRCHLLLDGGIRAPRSFPFQETIIGGDEKELLIALASILAKVRRDRRLVRLARRFPQYGFEQHKGYGTKAHYAALRKHGLCPVHRVSFLKAFTTIGAP